MASDIKGPTAGASIWPQMQFRREEWLLTRAHRPGVAAEIAREYKDIKYGASFTMEYTELLSQEQCRPVKKINSLGGQGFWQSDDMGQMVWQQLETHLLLGAEVARAEMRSACRARPLRCNTASDFSRLVVKMTFWGVTVVLDFSIPGIMLADGWSQDDH